MFRLFFTQINFPYTLFLTSQTCFSRNLNDTLRKADVTGFEVHSVENKDHMVCLTFTLTIDVESFTGEDVEFTHET